MILLTVNLWKRRTAQLALQEKDWRSRLNYLNLSGEGYESPRSMSNKFYNSSQWLKVRDAVIERDLGCDLGVPGMYIEGPIIVHHINPLTPEDFETWNAEKLFSMDNLISCSIDTHNKIHYGEYSEKDDFVERTPNDTTLWG